MALSGSKGTHNWITAPHCFITCTSSVIPFLPSSYPTITDSILSYLLLDLCCILSNTLCFL
jgi:hypothetical protein